MSDPVKITYLMLLMGSLFYVTIRVWVLGRPINSILSRVMLFIAGLSIVFYVRMIVHDFKMMDVSDEAMYVSLIKDLSKGLDPPISGPGFAYLILWVNRLTGIPIETTMMVFGMIVGSISLPVLLIIYRRSNLAREEAVLSCFLILTTSYFLWPMIEVRPQQAGALMVLIGMYAYVRSLEDDRYLWLFLVFSILAFVFHILSFLVLMGSVLGYWSLGYVEARYDLKKAIWPAAVFIAGMAVFISPLSLYSSMNGGVEWAFRRSGIDLFQNALFPITVMVLASIIIIPLLMFLRRKKALDFLEGFAKRKGRWVLAMIVIGTVIVLALQFLLDPVKYSGKYQGSAILFLFFQMGNLFFGGLFVHSYYRSLAKGRTMDPFFRTTSILMLMGVATLLVSLFLPVDFNNWMIRIINYWTIFAAPMIARDVIEMDPRVRSIIMLMAPLFIIVSLLNISRDVDFFGYP